MLTDVQTPCPALTPFTSGTATPQVYAGLLNKNPGFLQDNYGNTLSVLYSSTGHAESPNKGLLA